MAHLRKKKLKAKKKLKEKRKWAMEDRGAISSDDELNSLIKELLSVEGATMETTEGGVITIFHPGDEENPGPHFHAIG
jgi:hypothetical protein